VDWLRAKGLLIAAFTILDAFLFWRVSAALRPLPVVLAPPLTVASAPVDLARAGIDLAPGVRVPSQAPPLSLLPVQLHRQNPEAVASRFFPAGVTLVRSNLPGTPRGTAFSSTAETLDVFRAGILVYQRRATPKPMVPVLDASQARIWANQFVNRFGGLPADGAFDYVTPLGPTGYRVYDVETYQGLPLFAGYWRIDVGPSGIASAERFWLDVVPVRGVARPVRPTVTAAEALVRLASTLQAGPDSPLHVVGVTLGYYSQAYQQDRWWEMVPVWRVRLTGGGVHYINAYTGTLER
jgi:hypothetical protein